MRDRANSGSDGARLSSERREGRAPGKRTLTSGLPVHRKATRASGGAPVDVGRVAQEGVSGPAAPLPYAEDLRLAFGVDLDHIEAHVGGPASQACESLSASAYATGNHVAFATSPDLHTVAHEVAHVLQQGGGSVRFAEGLGRDDDPAEREADAVADAVVRGESVGASFGRLARSSTEAPVVRRKSSKNGEERSFAGAGVEMLGLVHYRIWGFAVDSAELPREGESMLDLVSRLTAGDKKTSVEVAGHTSTSGSERHNRGLSDERARRAYKALVARGVDPDRIVWRGLGESDPYTEEYDPSAMARNRRVEIRIDGLDANQLKRPDPAAPPTDVPKTADGPALSCADLKEQARWLRAHYMAWNYWIQDRGSPIAKGIKDPGFDSYVIRPSRDQVDRAGIDVGIRDDHDIDALTEQIAPISIGDNLGAHMRELESAARDLERQSKDPSKCDPNAGRRIKLMTFEDTVRDRKARADRDIMPPTNGRAPGGQRY